MTPELMLVLRQVIANAPLAQLLLKAKLEGHLEVSQDKWVETCRSLLAERTRLLELMDHAVEYNLPLTIRMES